MQDNPLVSIGMPVYNGAARIGNALDSVLAQEYENLEIIISDNCSTDDTLEVCRKYALQDKRILIYPNERNLGPMLNFEKVLQLAHGQYFMWAADDDSRSPNYVSALLEQFREYPNAILSAGKTIIVGLEGSPHPEGTWFNQSSPEDVQESRISVAVRFLEQHSASWIYGLFRTDLLRSEFPLLKRPPSYGSDMILLIHIILKYQVTGTDAAIFYCTSVKHNPLAPVRLHDIWRWRLQYSVQLYLQIYSSSLSLRSKYKLRRIALLRLKNQMWCGMRCELTRLLLACWGASRRLMRRTGKRSSLMCL